MSTTETKFTEEMIWEKLVQINKELHNRDDWDGMDTEWYMSEMIGEKSKLDNEQLYELTTLLQFSSKRNPNVEFTYYNYLTQNDFDKEIVSENIWNYYIDCIMEY